jgi:RNA polymerase sigma-70 factor (ECF subfamily)
MEVARRKAIDQLRRERTAGQLEESLRTELSARLEAAAEPATATDPLGDDQLRLIFLCCHPALPRISRIALTLKTASGLSVREIGRVFLSDEVAVAQRLARARKLLREIGAPVELPPEAEIPARLDAVLDVLYLTFTEGHTASEGDDLVRQELCREALRLTELLLLRRDTSPPRVHALAALFCFLAARFPTRLDGEGVPVLLAAQDRSRWDRELITRGLWHFERCAAGDAVSRYHIEAEIASHHTLAPTWEATDWAAILAAYDRLLALAPSPVVALHRAVAVRFVHGDAAALAALDAAPQRAALERFPSCHSLRGELLLGLGRTEAGIAALQRAADLARSAPVRRLLERRLAGLSGEMS